MVNKTPIWTANCFNKPWLFGKLTNKLAIQIIFDMIKISRVIRT